MSACIIHTVVPDIERFHSRDYWPYWFIETKESIFA